MNRAGAREVVDDLGIRVLASDGLGILVERYSNATGYERWRVHTGGGIAGDGDQAWLSPVSRGAGREPRGPFSTKRELEAALRAWRRELRTTVGWRTQRRLAGGLPRRDAPRRSRRRA